MSVTEIVVSGGDYHICHITQSDELIRKGHLTSLHSCCVGRKVHDWRCEEAKVQFLIMFFRVMFGFRFSTIGEEKLKLTEC